MNERMHERMNEWMDERLSEWIGESMNESMNGWPCGVSVWLRACCAPCARVEKCFPVCIPYLIARLPPINRYRSWSHRRLPRRFLMMIRGPEVLSTKRQMISDEIQTGGKTVCLRPYATLVACWLTAFRPTCRTKWPMSKTGDPSELRRVLPECIPGKTNNYGMGERSTAYLPHRPLYSRSRN